MNAQKEENLLSFGVYYIILMQIQEYHDIYPLTLSPYHVDG